MYMKRAYSAQQNENIQVSQARRSLAQSKKQEEKVSHSCTSSDSVVSHKKKEKWQAMRKRVV